jgi:hypothetical protein
LQTGLSKEPEVEDIPWIVQRQESQSLRGRCEPGSKVRERCWAVDLEDGVKGPQAKGYQCLYKMEKGTQILPWSLQEGPALLMP